ncbi:MAG: FAD-binding oxidoreductase, partial [Anaerolineales bacterium]|nr:FAD-binding oxidoreductase [Anaerolineales bacterium]
MDSGFVAELRRIVGAEHVSTAESERHIHGADQSSHERVLPDVVVWPASTAEVSQVARLANEARVAITGWGAGSSLEGNSIPLNGGLV